MTTVHFTIPDLLATIPLDAHTVIEASAGTGKTYTLEHLVVHLLLERKLSIDEILIVTFTRRATGELRERVRALIERMCSTTAADEPGEPRRAIGPEERRLLERALRGFDDAQIFTIHSFCQTVLTDHAFENRQLFDGELVAVDDLFERCFYDVLRSTYAVDDELRGWLDLWLFYEADAVDKIRDELRASHTSNVPLWPVLDALPLSQIRADIEKLIHDKKRANKDAPLFTKLRTAVLHLFQDRVEEAIRRTKQDEGLYTFDDLLTIVHDTLAGDPSPTTNLLLEDLRRRYRYALVDEFQDTDPVQWGIFRRVFLDSGGDNILYVIGDPKQAIYGFRGADIDTYFEAVAHVGRAPVTLATNFRSSEAMIAGYNRIFDSTPDAQPPFFTDRNRYDHPVRAGRPGDPALALVDRDGRPARSGDDGEPLAAIEILRLDTADLASAPTTPVLRASFVQAIAGEISRLLSPGSGVFLPTPGGAPRALRPRDIYVLTRSNHETRMVGRALRIHNVPYAFYREEGLFQTREARHIHDMLRAVDDPSDRSRRLKCYHTPFFGVPLERLDPVDALEHPTSPRRTLARLNLLARRRRFRELFAALLEDSGLVRRELLLGDGERALTNYGHLFELLLNRSREVHGELADLVFWLGACIDGRADAGGEDGNLQRLETDADAVQVMTIHKSKGLEAEVVFVLGGFGLSRIGRRRFVTPETADATPRHKAECLKPDAFDGLDPSKKEIEARWHAHVREEAERLMYVALTRAKTRMYLPYYDFERRPADGDYAPVLERLDTIVAALETGQLPPGQFHVTDCPVVERLPARDAATPDALARWDLSTVLEAVPDAPDSATPSLDPPALRRRQLSMVSYSSLTASDSYRPEPGAASAEPAEPAEAAEAIEQITSEIRGTRGGSFVHDILERIDFKALAAAPNLEAWSRLPAVERTIGALAKRYRYDVRGDLDDAIDRTDDTDGIDATNARAQAEARAMIYDALTTPIAVSGATRTLRLAELETFARELRFVFPIPERGHPPIGALPARVLEVRRGYAQGFIDLLFDFEGKTYFADWKTDHLPGRDYSPGAMAAHVAANYPTQATIYTMATLRMLGIDSEAAFDARFGGYFYFFVRGMSPAAPAGHGVHHGTTTWADVQALERAIVDSDDRTWRAAFTARERSTTR